MEARYSARASYAWKSILSTRRVIKIGSRWRIGNGRSAKVWHDKWLPLPSLGKPISPPSILPSEACVSSLIHAEGGTWNKDLIDSAFLPSEAKLISSLVLSTMGLDDKLVWGREQDGKYTVRSGYRLLCETDWIDEPGLLFYPVKPSSSQVWF
jgi:hypothetical protein